MEARLHELSFDCVECGKPIAILHVKAMADGRMFIDGICISCGHEIVFELHVMQMMLRCMEYDFLAPYEQSMKEGSDA